MCCRVAVSISGRLFFCIFSCDPLLFLSGVLCPSPQSIGALLFLYDVWLYGQNTTGLLCSGGHRLKYCLLCCVFSGAVVLSLLSALEVCEVPGQMGDIPPGGLHFCRKVVCPYGVDVFHFHDTDKI